jgi:hypothetical protein
MMSIRQFLLAVALSIWGLAASAQVPVVTNPTFGDDSYVHVPLQFGFPFYGRTFTNSWMHSNGVVSFFDPAAPMEGAGYNPGAWAYCCSGERPTTNSPQFSYMIAPLWTDLYPVASSTFRTEGTDQYQLYQWNNIAEISNMSNLNSFSLEIRPSGFIGATYSAFRIQNQQTWVGTIGDATQGEWNEIYYGVGVPGQSLKNWSLTETVAVDLCTVSPTSSPSCPGYTDAMCASNPMYSSSCPGYAEAYFTQQCLANPLYNSACPGYATAYYSYQCSSNTLYHTGCPGYAQAYFDQQCGLDPLYNQACPGHADAYYVQQCTANPLYDSGCTGYAQAYFDQQCANDALYNSQCPGYETAYFNQQCANDALYNSQCSGYGEAYAKKYILVAAPAVETAIVAETVVVAQATVTETKEVTAAATATETAPAAAVSASPAAAATAPVSLVAAPAPAAAPAEKKAETRTETAAAGGSDGESKSQPTTRQALAQRRLAAAREAAAESTRANPSAVASQMDSAASMEQQVELQNVVLGAMGFVAGFDAYGRVNLQDAAGYKPFEIYRGQRNVDSAAARGLLGRSDRIHQDMVDSQYNK